jgi:hypothetical protein
MKKLLLLSSISVFIGFTGLLLLAGSAHAKKTAMPPSCNAAVQIFPGDGYPNPDAFGVSGHGPALSYTDNLDGTFTDCNTKYMWEKKTGTLGSDVFCSSTAECPDPHDVNNLYIWSSTGTAFDGTASTVFLAQLNDVAGGGANCFAGYCDWRIPNVKELQSIVDYSVLNPSTSVPGLTKDAAYWTATTVAESAGGDVWLVSGFEGFVDLSAKESSPFAARAVRP